MSVAFFICSLIRSSTFFTSSSVSFLVNPKSNLNLSLLMFAPFCEMLGSRTFRRASFRRCAAVWSEVVSSELSARPPVNFPFAAVRESF